ncbi:hypothetical protein OROGR_010141 [Orobanche gracilis]
MMEEIGRMHLDFLQIRLMLEMMQKNNKGKKTTHGPNKTMGKKRTASDHLIEKSLDEPYWVRELRNPYNIPEDSRSIQMDIHVTAGEVATLVMCQKDMYAVRMKKKKVMITSFSIRWLTCSSIL